MIGDQRLRGDAAVLNLFSRQRSDAGLGRRRRCARGDAARIISTYAKGAASSLACLLAAGTDGAGTGKAR
jgi:hypothetical protein